MLKLCYSAFSTDCTAEISREWILKRKCRHCPVTLLVCSKQLPQEGHGLIVARSLFEVGLLRATTRILQNKHIHRSLEVDKHFQQHTYQPSIVDTVEFHIRLVNETCRNSPNTSVQTGCGSQSSTHARSLPDSMNIPGSDCSQSVYHSQTKR